MAQAGAMPRLLRRLAESAASSSPSFRLPAKPLVRPRVDALQSPERSTRAQGQAPGPADPRARRNNHYRSNNLARLRIATRSLASIAPLDSKARPKQGSGAAHLCTEIPRRDYLVTVAASSRNGRRQYSVTVGDISSFWWAGFTRNQHVGRSRAPGRRSEWPGDDQAGRGALA